MSDSKVIIVTGANSGIGLEAAKGLCALGHDVVISVRDDKKGEDALAAIKLEVPAANISFITMELTSPDSIREFVAKFKQTGKKLNVLLNNAGMFREYSSAERFTARDNPTLEVTMIANCMGPFLLTNLLLDELKANGTAEKPSRIVNVSSMMTNKGRGSAVGFFIDDLMLEKEGSYKTGAQSYRNSKLALNLWSNEMAEKLKGSNVILNTVCPGFIPSTSLGRNNTGMGMKIGMAIMDSFIGRFLIGTKPPSEGKRRLIDMALDESRGTNGCFYADDKLATEAEEVLDNENKEKIWTLCVKYSGL